MKKDKGKKQRKESLTKGIIGKFSIAQKSSRFEIAKELEKRLNQPEGKGTHRSLGSERALMDRIERLRTKR